MNQREEERVIEALRALTGGLTVTDQDIISAGGRLRSGLEPPPGRRRAVLLGAAAAAAVLAGVVAVQAVDRDEGSAPPSTPPATPAETLQKALQADPYLVSETEFTTGRLPSAETLAGLWVLRPVDASPPDEFKTAPLYVDGDGDWRIGAPTAPLGWGESTLVGDTWTRNLDERSQCARNDDMVGLVQSSMVTVGSDGSLRVRLTDAVHCTILDDREVWDPVTPGSPVMDYFQAAVRDTEWGVSQTTVGEAAEGVYVAPGTGHLLVIDPKGSYRYYDNLTAAKLVAADSGEFEVDSSLDTAVGTCAGGTFSGRVEVGDTPGVAGYVHPLTALRITATENGCGSGFLEQGAWLRLFGGFTDSPYQD